MGSPLLDIPRNTGHRNTQAILTGCLVDHTAHLAAMHLGLRLILDNDLAR